MKRGPKPQGHYSTCGTYNVPPHVADLARRRTQPFLDSIGMGKPLEVLMQEAYMMGIKDAVETMTIRD